MRISIHCTDCASLRTVTSSRDARSSMVIDFLTSSSRFDRLPIHFLPVLLLFSFLEFPCAALVRTRNVFRHCPQHDNMFVLVYIFDKIWLICQKIRALSGANLIGCNLRLRSGGSSCENMASGCINYNAVAVFLGWEIWE